MADPRDPGGEPLPGPAGAVPTPPSASATAVAVEPTGIRLAAVLAMLLAALAVLALASGGPLGVGARPLMMLPGAAAMVLGIVAWRWARRKRYRASWMAVMGVLVGGFATLLGSFQFLIVYVLAERFDPEPPQSVRSSQLATLSEQQVLEDAAALAASRLVLLAGRADGVEVTETVPTTRFPSRLAVTTDGEVLITPDGDVLAGIPARTRVSYSTFDDGNHFELALAGPLGGHAWTTDAPTQDPRR
ncbi:hypothetical protein GCM10009819_20300 [Agromyces tropicus]|uniref:DUF4190 domain-containing protein n=1 Tax=Agromyces tropicus TaxID=555371 RepID=A0ABN2UF48_9MICO